MDIHRKTVIRKKKSNTSVPTRSHAECLNVDNTIFNSISLGMELDLIPKTSVAVAPIKKSELLSLSKNALRKTSSGFSSMSSFENYEIEADDSLSNIQQPIASKRPSEQNLPALQGKKIKLEKKYSPQKICDLNINLSGVDILQDTLDSINVTEILEDKNKEKCSEKREFDAFAYYLSNTHSPKNNVKRPLFNAEAASSSKIAAVEKPECNDNGMLSQFFTTQVIRQIDTATKNRTTNIAKEEYDADKPENIKSDSVKNDDVFKVPLLQSFQDKLKHHVNKRLGEIILDKEIGERSQLFEDEKITSQYRQQVDNLFEQLEHSIFAMGTSHMSDTIPEKFLDIIFSDDLKRTENVENPNSDPNSNSENIEWPENSILNGVSFNASFGTVIKKALINNATKAVQKSPSNKFIASSKGTEKNHQFRRLGPFYGLPLKVKELVRQYKGIEELYDWQNECLKLPAVENKKNLIYALPTSGGKTLVAEILILREILCYNRNAIFILPYVSIVQEKVWALSPFAVALDFLVEEYASSKGVYPPRQRRRKNSVYIATIEKALGITNSLIESNRLQEIGLIVVDELHLIGEEGRGAALEACLTKIMFLNANVQIVGMSATIGNLRDIYTFLNAEVYTKDFRPVELIEYVKCGTEIAKVNWAYTDEKELLVDPKRVDYKYSSSLLKIDPDMVGGLVMDVIPKGSCLIFCASKRNCENVANMLCKLCKPELQNHKKTEKEQVINALKDEAGALCDTLKVSVKYGIAYHHSGLTSDERRIIEDGFRAGIIYVICCTSTLAAGVNLPARRVILRSPYIGRDFINLSRYKQMAGRAGRAGLGEIGDSILITQPQDMPKVKKLLMSPMNQALSGMHNMEGKGLRHLLLSCISLGIANTREQLQAVTRQTLLAVQKDKLEVDIKKLTDKIIRNLFKLGALQASCGQQKKEESSALCDVSVRMNVSTANIQSQNTPASEQAAGSSSSKERKTIVLTNDTKLVVSELGCAAIKGGLELLRAHILYEDLYQAQSSLVLQGHLHLLYLVTPYETADQIKPNMQVYYQVLTDLKPNELKVAKILGLNESVAVKMLSSNPIKNVSERVLNRFYVTLMLYDLWNEMPVFQVSEKYLINRGIVQNLMTVAATFASNVVNFCQELEEFWAYSHLLKGMSQRLSHCCVKELLPLMELPAVKQSRAKQLYNSGYKTLQSIARANVEDLMESIEFMTRRVANQLIAASKMLLLERVENLREEAEDVLDGVEDPKPLFEKSGSSR